MDISTVQKTIHVQPLPKTVKHNSPRFRIKLNKTKINFWVDLGLFVLILLTIAFAFIDIPTHKWFGYGMLAAVAVHLALHWAWIKAIGQRFLKKMPLQMRIKAIIDMAMLIVFLLLTMSGVIVSLIYAPNITHFHNICFYILTALLLLHLTLSWKWIAAQAKRMWVK